MPETKELISCELRQRLEDFAREQHREPAEIVEEVIGRYLAIQMLEKLGAKFERVARAKGIREEDIPELVHQVRRENEERNRENNSRNR